MPSGNQPENDKLPVNRGFTSLSGTRMENTEEFFTHKTAPTAKGGFFKTKNIRKKKGKLKKFLIFSLGLILFVSIVGASAGVALVAYVSRDLPNPDEVTKINIRSSYIYDRDGNLLTEVFSQDIRRDPIDIEEIPQYTQDAVVAIEDKRFYEHEGVDPIRIVGALISNVKTDSIQGGSTLTQQFMKNTLLSEEKNERSNIEGYSRKIREIILAIQIERSFEKKEILEMYLNSIPWGDVAYGIGSASRLYFDKEVSELDIPESAMLAAMIQSPTFLSPYGNNIDQLTQRRDTVLRFMEDQGYITSEQREEAQKVPIVKPGEDVPATFVKTMFEPTRISERKHEIKYPHFTYYVKEILAERFGEKNFAQGGYKVYTTLDSGMQEKAEATLKDNRDKINQFGGNNGSIVAIDPKTGQIMAMAGSIDYNDLSVNGNFNVATAIPGRQMGSSFKIYDYASAFERGFVPDTYLYDVRTEFPGWSKNEPPQNYSRTFSGPIKMKNALPRSLNIPAIKAMYLGGINETINLAREAGADSFDLGKNRAGNPYGLSASLGSEEMPLMEHTAGYATFANNGVRKYMEVNRGGETRREPVSILKIEDSRGNVIFNAEKDSKELRAFSEVTARYLQTILSDINLRPSWSRGFYPKTDKGTWGAMIKTGTTNDNKDSVMMGAVPSLAAGVWVGNTDNSELSSNATGSSVSGPIWVDFMSRALEGRELEEFTPTEDVIDGSCYADNKPMASGSLLGGLTSTKVVVNRETGKLATDFTPTSLKETRLYYRAKSILDFVNPEMPCGNNSKDPVKNEMTEIWGEGVDSWAKKNADYLSDIISGEDGVRVFFGDPPTEEDEITEEMLPSVSVEPSKTTMPASAKNLSITLGGDAPLGLDSMTVKFDGVEIGNYTDFGSYTIPLPSGLKEKSSVLEVILLDKQGQTASDSVIIKISNTEDEKEDENDENDENEDDDTKDKKNKITIQETSGVDGDSLTGVDLPAKVTFSIKNATQISVVLNSSPVSFTKSGNDYSITIKKSMLKEGPNEIVISATSDESSLQKSVRFRYDIEPQQEDKDEEKPSEKKDPVDQTIPMSEITITTTS
jgi:membrane peptidoglycan carboxypeptidase